MGELYCGCDKAKKGCEKVCTKYAGKLKPTRTYLIPTWKKSETKKLTQIT